MKYKNNSRVKNAVENSQKYKLDTYEYDYTQSVDWNLKRLSKVADQRLVRLESYTHDKGYSLVKSFAYARAIKDIEKWSGEGATRFNRKDNITDKQKLMKIADILTFINSPTSTKQGITRTFQQKANTLNERYKENGLNLTWEDLAMLNELGFIGEGASYGSDTVFKALGKFEQSYKELAKDLNSKGNNYKKLLPKKDKIKIFNEMLTNKDIRIEDLI